MQLLRNEKPRYKHLSLFSGIGGIDLAAHEVGFDTVAFVERDKFCQKILNKHWPEVPIYDDVKRFGADEFNRYGGVHLISGGFPCQPFSFAGARRGAEDERFLWPEMLRVVGIFRPDWVLGENVRGFVSMGLDNCMADLEAIGYEVGAIIAPACGVGALHRRERVFIVAHTSKLYGDGCHIYGEHTECTIPESGNGRFQESLSDTESEQDRRVQFGGIQFNAEASSCASNVADSERERCGQVEQSIRKGTQGKRTSRSSEYGSVPNGRRWWASEPELGRVAYGVPNRMDRLRSLGNAVVPQQVQPILQGIYDLLL